MKKLAIILAVGTAALMGSSVANAADNSAKARSSLMPRNRGLLRNPRLTSVRATAMAIGAAITTTIATGAIVTTGRTTTAMATTRRVRTAITAVPATTAVAPA